MSTAHFERPEVLDETVQPEEGERVDLGRDVGSTPPLSEGENPTGTGDSGLEGPAD